MKQSGLLTARFSWLWRSGDSCYSNLLLEWSWQVQEKSYLDQKRDYYHKLGRLFESHQIEHLWIEDVPQMFHHYSQFWNRSKIFFQISYVLELGFKKSQDKVGCVFPVVIWSELHLGQHRDDDYREDAPHFTGEIEIVPWSMRVINCSACCEFFPALFLTFDLKDWSSFLQ